MELTFTFDKDYVMENIVFDGLNGREYVTSTKDALNVMKLKNPAVDFTRDVKRGVYDSLSDEEYERALGAIECVSRLWRYPDEPEDRSTEYEMNVLALLANAIRLISRQNALLRRDRKE